MYQLCIGNKNYSSWSLRPWVLMTELGIPFSEKVHAFAGADNFAAFRQFSPSGKVPCLIDGETAVWDSLAIAEYLHERHATVWPQAQAARDFARCAAAEMHAGFEHLRALCPMNCAVRLTLHEIPGELKRDLQRIDELWREGLARFSGAFLAGERFTAVDAFYCPVAFRCRTYDLPLSDEAGEYCQRLLALDGMQTWFQDAIAEPWREDLHEAEMRRAGVITEDLRD